MSDVLKGLDNNEELKEMLDLQKEQLEKITKAKESLHMFNFEAGKKVKEITKNFGNNAKILEKVKDDLTFIHKAIRCLDKHFNDEE